MSERMPAILGSAVREGHRYVTDTRDAQIADLCRRFDETKSCCEALLRSNAGLRKILDHVYKGNVPDFPEEN